MSTSNSAEAHLVAEALRQEGISASVQGEWGSLEAPSVWIDDDTDAQRANALITEIMAKRESAPTPVHAPGRSSGFVGGVLLGVLIGGVVTAVLVPNLVKDSVPNSSESWDLNGDGVPDSWARYDTAGRLVESSEDHNHDRRPDSWCRSNATGHSRMIASRIDGPSTAGRKIREEYDRNRDGVFEEAVVFDEFERVISRR